jgi:predicted O-methyltransferase YrrM
MIPHLINETLNGTGDSSQHTMALFGLALTLKAKNILELGVRAGLTTLPLLHSTLYTGGHLTSIDIEENAAIRQLHNNNSSNWDYIISEAQHYLKNLPQDKIFDLVLIDDWHDGDHLFEEIKLIEPHITPSSLILIHDCMCYNTQPSYHVYLDKEGEFANGGPYGAVQRLDREIWEYSTIPVNNGMTILRKLDKTLIF